MRDGLNGLLDSQVSMSTFCLHPTLKRRNALPAPFCFDIEYWVHNFPLSLTSSLSSLSLHTPRSYRERREALGTLLWDSAGGRIVKCGYFLFAFLQNRLTVALSAGSFPSFRHCLYVIIICLKDQTGWWWGWSGSFAALCSTYST